MPAMSGHAAFQNDISEKTARIYTPNGFRTAYDRAGIFLIIHAMPSMGKSIFTL
jgi:hypothetical protein